MKESSSPTTNLSPGIPLFNFPAAYPLLQTLLIATLLMTYLLLADYFISPSKRSFLDHSYPLMATVHIATVNVKSPEVVRVFSQGMMRVLTYDIFGA